MINVAFNYVSGGSFEFVDWFEKIFKIILEQFF